MADAITKGALVRFTRETTRYGRDCNLVENGNKHEIKIGLIGIVVGEVTGAWTTNKTRPVIFTSRGHRVCELPENLEVLCKL